MRPGGPFQSTRILIFSSGVLPAIFQSWLNGKTSDIEFWASSILFWQFLRLDFAVQCSGQLIIESIEINESALRYFQSLFSGFPQAISGASKGESEGCYNSGRDSSEESIMTVDKAPGRSHAACCLASPTSW